MQVRTGGAGCESGGRDRTVFLVIATGLVLMMHLLPCRSHEIREAQECIAAGRVESERWPLAATIKLLALMDDARAQMGVVYPSDAESVSLEQSASL